MISHLQESVAPAGNHEDSLWSHPLPQGLLEKLPADGIASVGQKRQLAPCWVTPAVHKAVPVAAGSPQSVDQKDEMLWMARRHLQSALCQA